MEKILEENDYKYFTSVKSRDFYENNAKKEKIVESLYLINPTHATISTEREFLSIKLDNLTYVCVNFNDHNDYTFLTDITTLEIVNPWKKNLKKIKYPPNIKNLIFSKIDFSWKRINLDLFKKSFDNLPIYLEKIILVDNWWLMNLCIEIEEKPEDILVFSEENQKFKKGFDLVKLPFGCKVYYINKFNRYTSLLDIEI
jgi:hypothetical protein